MLTLCPQCTAGTPLYDFNQVCCRVRLLETLPNFPRQKAQIDRWLRHAERMKGPAALEERNRVQQVRDEMNRRHRAGRAA